MSDFVMSSESGVCVEAIFFYRGSNTKCHMFVTNWLMFIIFRHYIIVYFS